MIKYKIKRNDKVMIIAGKEKGKVGIVKQLLPVKNRVLVEGLNKVIDFNKATRTGLSEKEASIHISNVSHVDPVSGESTRTKIVINGDTKHLVSKKSHKVIRQII